MEVIKTFCMQYFSEIQEILKDIPELSIINLKKDLEAERKIVLSDIEELLIKLKNE